MKNAGRAMKGNTKRIRENIKRNCSESERSKRR